MVKTYILKNNSTGMYKEERVKILEIINGYAYLWIPSKQEEIAIPFPNNKLRNIKPQPKVIRMRTH